MVRGNINDFVTSHSSVAKPRRMICAPVRKYAFVLRVNLFAERVHQVVILSSSRSLSLLWHLVATIRTFIAFSGFLIVFRIICWVILFLPRLLMLLLHTYKSIVRVASIATGWTWTRPAGHWLLLSSIHNLHCVSSSIICYRVGFWPRTTSWYLSHVHSTKLLALVHHWKSN